MKNLILLIFLVPSLCFCEGPLFKQRDPLEATYIQQEFENVYKDIRRVNNRTKLIQHVNGNSVTNFTTTSGSFITTGSSVTITLIDPNSTVHITASGLLRNSNMALTQAYATIYRDSTNICGGGSSLCSELVDASLTGNMVVPSAMAIDDAPGAGTHVYSVRIMSNDAVSTVGWGNIGSCQIFADEYEPQ